MKLLNKFRFGILLTSMSVLLLATACEDEITRDPSPEYNTSSANVYFASSNSSSVVIGVNAASFEVTISREKTTAAQTVKLKGESAFEDLFTFPESVTFAAGEASKVVTVGCGDMDLMTSYHIAMEIDGNETKPYTAQTVYPRLEINVLKEDFEPYANGTYSAYFLYLLSEIESYYSYPLTLEYSEMSETYRLKKTWGVEGYNMTFKWDGANAITIGGTSATVSGVAYKVFKTGYMDSTYGMVSAYFASTASYNATTKKFTFPINWRVSAGGFGSYNDSYTITTLL